MGGITYAAVSRDTKTAMVAQDQRKVWRSGMGVGNWHTVRDHEGHEWSLVGDQTLHGRWERWKASVQECGRSDTTEHSPTSFS